METLTHKVVNMEGKEVGTIGLNAKIFGAPIRESLVHQTVRWQRAKRRAGTHSALTRGDKQASDRKPFKQKGTGRARAGTRNSPTRVGGGVAHGPKPRSYEFRLNKSARRQAMASVLSDKLRNEKIVVLDKLEIESGKTKDFVKVLQNLGINSTDSLTLLGANTAAGQSNQGLLRSSGNVKRVRLLPVEGANVYDLVNRNYLVGTQAAIEALQSKLLGENAAEGAK